MREILFRGKRFDNNEWVEGGFYLEPYTDNAYIVAWNSMGMGFIEYVLVCKETVGQFTGLKDKNGKRIFEGDILCAVEMDDPDFVGCVDYKYICWCVIGRNWADSLYAANTLHDLVVIGNIHDNPELIAEAEG